jgi:hypothetical protein
MVYRTGCLRELPKINRAKSNKEFLIAMASALLALFTTTWFLNKVFPLNLPFARSTFPLPLSPFPARYKLLI